MFNVNGYNNYANNVKNFGFNKANDKKAEDKKAPDFPEQPMQPPKAETNYDSLQISSVKEKTQELSKTAQDYLAKLKEKNPDMDFIIADFSTDEEADSLLAQGKGKYNVLITPDLLERMAADEAVAEEYEGIIASSVADIESAKEQLGEDADMVEKFGVSIDSNGEVTYRASLIDGLTNSEGGNTVKASTIGELLDRLNETKTAQAEKLAEIRAKKAEEAEKAKAAEEAKKAEEAKDAEEKPADVTLSDVEKVAAGVVDWAEELIEVTKFADFTADA